MKTFFASSLGVAALMLAGSVSAAAAVPGASVATEKASSAPAAGSAGERAARPEPKYCFMSEITGSRIAKKECKTRKEWEDLGVEVPKQR